MNQSLWLAPGARYACSPSNAVYFACLQGPPEFPATDEITPYPAL